MNSTSVTDITVFIKYKKLIFKMTFKALINSLDESQDDLAIEGLKPAGWTDGNRTKRF
jgi:hypothetical protein